MTIQLFAHPLSSYCHKAAIALYERGIPFELLMIAPDEPEIYARFASLWPMAKMPLLVDGARVVAESSIIIEYADRLGSGARMVPADPEASLEARFMDRCFDDYVMTPMSAIVAERIRPEGKADPFGVEQARVLLDKSYAWLEGKLAGREWAAGDAFGIADCAAAPALWYARHIHPFDAYPALWAYHERLEARPSVARTRKEAEPYWSMFPFSGGPDA